MNLQKEAAGEAVADLQSTFKRELYETAQTLLK